MTKPKILIFSGYGLNCEEESKFVFEKLGGEADIIHINDLIDQRRKLFDYQIIVFPGGFSYGDDTGSGNAFAAKLANHLWEEINTFVHKDKLVIGICNGFQILVNLGLLPGLEGKYGERKVALLHNNGARYLDRWVDVSVQSTLSPWLAKIDTVSLPIAHGEGKFYAQEDVLKILNKKKMVALRYIQGEICKYQNLPANPNGSLEDIAGISDETGRIFGLMPHPERAFCFTQLPHWTYLKEQLIRNKEKLPTDGPGLQIFRNGLKYFK